MIIKIEPLLSHSPVKCGHVRCYEHNAKWLIPQIDTTHLDALCCSVHLARYVEDAIRLGVPGTHAAHRSVDVAALISKIPVLCDHPRCDGRSAKWTFPQTAYRPEGPLHCCSVHLPRFCEIALKYHVPAAAPGKARHDHRKPKTRAA